MTTIHENSAPKVLISYSHDSPEHANRVLNLCDRLREHGIDAYIDQYEPHPPKSWPLWMEDQIETADFVLIVFTSTYHRRATGKEKRGRGRGVAWEGAIIRNELYDDVYANTKFIPLLFDLDDQQFILSPLRGGTYHVIESLEFDGRGYEQLYRRLSNQPIVQRPILGELQQLPAKSTGIDLWKTKDRAADRPLSAHEVESRKRYLAILKADIENRLRVSIHNARFIDLGIEDTPAATRLPFMYQDPESAQQFRSFAEAFNTYHRRLLLLGDPGSGKTTTVLHIAQQLIQEAEDDLAAPIPLVANLSKFQFEKTAASFLRLGNVEDDRPRDGQVERWLALELNQYPGLRDVARKWVEEGKIAALLDGLDEVDDEFRSELVQLLNATYFRDQPHAVVVVCSRIHEYAPLQDRDETRLQLGGAITLQALRDSEINNYLSVAKAEGLREALAADAQLYEMAQTPLTLSMMTLAYGELAPADIPSYDSMTAQRHHLMKAYVGKMLQRKERRDRGSPYEVPLDDYQYSPEQVDECLGWLAVRLSVRMQTAFSLDHFFGFLARDVTKDERSFAWWATNAARAVPLMIGVFLLGLTIMPWTLAGFLQTTAIALFMLPLGVIVSTVVRSAERVSSVLGRIAAGIGIVAVFTVVVAALGVFSQALSEAMDIGVPAVPMGLISLAVAIATVTAGLLVFPDARRVKLGLVVMTVALLLAASIAMRSGYTGPVAYPLAMALVVLQVGICAAVIVSDGESRYLLNLGGFVVALVACQSLSVWLIGDLAWYEVFVVVSAFGLLFLAAAGEADVLIIALLLVSIIGGAMGGPAGAALGAALFFFLCIVALLFVDGFPYDSEWKKRIESFFKAVNLRIMAFLDRRLLSPMLLRSLGATRCLPFRYSAFVNYSIDAILLKRAVGGDTEFVHRLLRDYFALRDLQPQLYSDDLERRLAAIRSLGYQGESAIGVLAELIKDPDPNVRAASVTAMSRIASPHIVDHLEAAVQDQSADVRRAAVVGARNMPKEDAKKLLETVRNEDVSDVQFAFIETVLHVFYSWEFRDYLRPMLETAENRDALLAHLLDLLGTSSAEDVRKGAARMLGECGDASVVQPLVELLSNRRYKSRAHVADALGRLGDARAFKPLLKALTDRDATVRRSAADALGELKDTRGVEPLIKALSDRDPKFRRSAAGALGQLNDTRGVEPLIKALSDRDPKVRQSAVDALGGLKDTRGVEPLIKTLSDPESAVRIAVADALGKSDDTRGIETLIKAISDPEVNVRKRAAKALAVLRNSALADVNRATSDALASIPDAQFLALFVDDMSINEAYTRYEAIEILGMLRDARAIELLVNALTDSEDVWQFLAEESLRKIGTAEALNAIQQHETRESDERKDL